jgi:type I restriction-modification system DNA methylase subunit
VTRQQAQSFLAKEHRAKIAAAYKSFLPDAGFSAVVSNEEILGNNGNLNIVTYVKRSTAKADSVDLPAAIKKWQTSSTGVRTSASELFKLLKTGSVKK